jgi:hypothetical protein
VHRTQAARMNAAQTFPKIGGRRKMTSTEARSRSVAFRCQCVVPFCNQESRGLSYAT